METHPAFLRLEPLLVDRGFRLLESSSWEDPRTDSKFVKYVREETTVFLVLDRGAWGSGIWFTLEGGKRYGKHPAIWARWIGAPLNDDTSIEDEAQFILEHVDDVEREVRRVGVGAVDAFTRALQRSCDETADRGAPLIRESLSSAPIIRPEAFRDEAWIACALHWDQAYARRIGFGGPSRLTYVIAWGDGHLHFVPTPEQIDAGLAHLKERGWVELRHRKEVFGPAPPAAYPLTPDEKKAVELAISREVLISLTETGLATIGSISGSGRRDVGVRAMEAWLRAHPLLGGEKGA